MATNTKKPSTTKVDPKKKHGEPPIKPGKKLTFREFLEIHKKLLPAINHSYGSPAFLGLLRNWNSLAILFPDRCADIVVWGIKKNHKGDPVPDDTPVWLDNDLSDVIAPVPQADPDLIKKVQEDADKKREAQESVEKPS